MAKEDFTAKSNELFMQDTGALKEGYAPFCKHLFVPNFLPDAVCTYVEITPENEQHLRSGYEARTEKELPVLSRWFDATKVTAPPAQYLDLILYSKEQIMKENEAMGQESPNAEIDYDWGIISVKPQMVDYETPMQPITAMRNSLGKEYGGSGVPMDFEKYKQAVEFWEKHAVLK